MKKNFVLILISILSFSCREDDSIEIPNTTEEELLFSISIPESFYLSGPGFNQTGQLLLTDNEGELIESGALSNNNKTELLGDFDIDNNEYFATIVNKIRSNNQTVYTIQTFVDVEPYELVFNERENLNPNGDSAKINIINTGGLIKDVLLSNSYQSNQNGGDFSLNILLREVPDEVYVSFKNFNEDFRRYLFLENLNGETEEIIEFSDASILNNSYTVTYPNNEYIEVEVLGSILPDLNKYFLLSETTHSTGTTSSIHDIPENMFDNYKVTTTLKKNGTTYLTYKKSNQIDLNYQLPNISFQISDDSIENYEMMSSSNYDYYSIFFGYVNYNENYNVAWTFYGVKQETVNIILPEIINLIFNNQPSFSFSDLVLQSSRVHKIEGINNYEQFINTTLDPNAEEISLITESQMVSKK